MDDMSGLALARKAAAVYTGVFVAGSALSIKRDYRAEPLGMKTSWSTKKGVLSGIQGAGLAAPGHLIVQMWLASALAGAPGKRGRKGRAWLAFLSALFIAGAVSEPVSQRVVVGDLPVPDKAVVVANVVVPGFMLGGALLSLTTDGESG